MLCGLSPPAGDVDGVIRANPASWWPDRSPSQFCAVWYWCEWLGISSTVSRCSSSPPRSPSFRSVNPAPAPTPTYHASRKRRERRPAVWTFRQIERHHRALWQSDLKSELCLIGGFHRLLRAIRDGRTAFLRQASVRCGERADKCNRDHSNTAHARLLGSYSSDPGPFPTIVFELRFIELGEQRGVFLVVTAHQIGVSLQFAVYVDDVGRPRVRR